MRELDEKRDNILHELRDHDAVSRGMMLLAILQMEYTRMTTAERALLDVQVEVMRTISDEVGHPWLTT